VRRSLRRGPRGVADGQRVNSPVPSRSVEPREDTGTKRRRLCGWPSKPVGESREGMARASFGRLERRGVDGREKSLAELRDDRTANRHRWARRVASGARVRRGQGTRHNDPVTSEEGMHASVKASRRQPERVAVNRPKRLFSKNTGACQAAQGAVYALTPARCRKVKGRG
jgi:hypothetical protein